MEGVNEIGPFQGSDSFLVTNAYERWETITRKSFYTSDLASTASWSAGDAALG